MKYLKSEECYKVQNARLCTINICRLMETLRNEEFDFRLEKKSGEIILYTQNRIRMYEHPSSVHPLRRMEIRIKETADSLECRITTEAKENDERMLYRIEPIALFVDREQAKNIVFAEISKLPQ